MSAPNPPEIELSAHDLRELSEEIVNKLRGIKASQRLGIFQEIQMVFCIHCGDKHVDTRRMFEGREYGRLIRCQCWNDE